MTKQIRNKRNEKKKIIKETKMTKKNTVISYYP